MGLRDRYELRALVAVAIQGTVCLAVIAYGLWSPSLGWRLLMPGLAIVAAFAALAWLTLHRPWDWDLVRGEEATSLLRRGWGYSEPAVVYGYTFGMAWLHVDTLYDVKAHTAEALDKFRYMHLGTMSEESARAWGTDTYGALCFGGPFVIAFVFAPLFFLALAWFLLPR